MKLFKQLCKKYSEKVYFWSIKDKKVIPTPQEVVETSKVLTFPDGAKLTVDPSKCSFDKYFNDWTTPMEEVFMLFVKDINNFDKTFDKGITTYTHKILGYTFRGSYNTYGNLNWSSNIHSLTSDQLDKIYNILGFYKYNDNMVEFDKLNRLRKAKNEARKINKYLRTLK